MAFARTAARTIACIRPEAAAMTAALAVPLFIAGPQWLVGSVVNTLLFLAALRLPAKYHLPIAVLPSLGALGHGVLFGSFTPFLIYFLPFIWLGNLGLMKAFARLQPVAGMLPSIIAGALTKSALLFVPAWLYVHFSLVPALFLTAMDLVQLYTALVGGLFAWFGLLAAATYANKRS